MDRFREILFRKSARDIFSPKTFRSYIRFLRREEERGERLFDSRSLATLLPPLRSPSMEFLKSASFQFSSSVEILNRSPNFSAAGDLPAEF